jgi:chromate transporter
MARTLCPDRERASIAVIVAAIILFSSFSVAQIGSIALGGVAGLWLCRGAPATKGDDHMSLPVSRPMGLLALAVFFLLLGGLPLRAPKYLRQKPNIDQTSGLLRRRLRSS